MRHVIAIALVLAACDGKKTGEDAQQGLPACASPVNGTTVTMRQIGRVVGGALLATAPRLDPDRLFVIEQRGAIRIFNAEQLLPEPFLDLSTDASGPVVAGGEQGLLGLAFHPKYMTNGLFFVYYTTRQPGNALRDVVARCAVSAADPNRADPASCVEVLSIPDFATNHNGGMIEFGNDGYLYIGTGDGGGGGDPQMTGQNRNSLLGKILRIDVDSTANGEYGIPSDNPFAAGGGAPEVFVYGVRNPWRFSFDRMTGDLWIGDVGQGAIEEMTVLRPAQQNGANLGWSMYEGRRCFAPPCSPTPENVYPQDERTHGDGWISIIAGQTYRGTCYPDIVGWHFYTDYGAGGLVRARLLEDDTLEIVDLPGSFPARPASLHDDARGEIYLTNTDGNVYHLEAAP